MSNMEEVVDVRQQAVGVFVRSPSGMMSPRIINTIRENHLNVIKNAFGLDKDQLNYYLPIVNLSVSVYGTDLAMFYIDDHLGEDGILVIQFETGLKPHHKANALLMLKPLIRKHKRVITTSSNGMFTRLGENK